MVLFRRFLFWLFVRLDVMSYSEFMDYDDALMRFFDTVTRNVEAQLLFNRLVAERLGLSPDSVNMDSVPLVRPLDREDVAFG